jgi:hypothetical protein
MWTWALIVVDWIITWNTNMVTSVFASLW